MKPDRCLFLSPQLGRRLFRPEREGLYRTAAYILIAAAVVLGLPLLD